MDGTETPVQSAEEELRRELEELRARNRELVETIDAIRMGEVDAIVVSQGARPQIYTLEGADYPYRLLVENIQEGALTLTTTGMILYANAAFAGMRNLPLSAVLGSPLGDHFAPRDRAQFDALLQASQTHPSRGEMSLCSGIASFPVQVSLTPVEVNGETKIGVVVTDRRQDYDRLRLLARMLDSVVDAVSATDPDGTIIYWNESAAQLYGWQASERIGCSLDDEVDHGISAEDARSVFERLTAGETWSGEYIASHRDGRRFPVKATRAPVYDEDGALVAVIGTSHDISERKAGEEALAESEADARSFMENMVDACAICETVTNESGEPIDIRLVDVNPAFGREIGFSPAEIAGMTASEILPGLPPVWFDRFLEVGRTGAAVEVEEPFSALGHWYRVAGFPVRGGRTAVLFRDITVRKEAEDALAESEERLRLAQEGAAVAVWDQDVLSGTMTYSSEFLRICGLDAGGTATNVGWLEYAHPDDVDRVRAESDAALARGEPFDLEYRIVRPSGDVRWIAASGHGYRDASGELVRVLGVNIDITERKTAELALARSAEELRRSNEELQRFAYVASHDLQEPLRSIVSFSQLLERRYRGKLDADADEYISFIVEGGNRMQTLISDLLQVSRVETAAKPLEPTDAGEVVVDVVRALETPLREAGATVTVEDLPIVMADAAQLEQIFSNLVGNAIKYRRPDLAPEIRISARRKGGRWEFAVADNGIGIDAEYFDRIFEMFQRLHTHDEYEGTGIGLALVKKIVDRHGGRVRVESTPGEGSTFYFTLPGP